MRIAFGTDEHTTFTEDLVKEMENAGHQVDVLADGDAWPDVGERIGRAVATGNADRGVVCCWTGTGVSMAANKVDGVRAALCTDAETARGARLWNDANVLALSLRLTTTTTGREMLDAFLSTDPDESEREQFEKLGTMRSEA